jgi:uncharacterized protein YdeI (YjbR/CyaY-like superfamily)
MHPEVDQLMEIEKNWKQEMLLLREIVLESRLTEDFKWKQACYTFNGNNVIILGSFKSSCVISFLKGVLLKDESQLLQFPGENSQSAKLLRFTSSEEIIRLKPQILSYIREAIVLEEMGAKVDTSTTPSQPVPDELVNCFEADTNFKEAFESLTTGRQRAYLIFFNAAKQSATKTDRINKYKSRILSGKGINDCVCGLSKKMPGCDGSHKYLQS